MNKTGNQTLLVCDESFKLLGTVSDGDIRKALIVGKTMDTCISEIMNPKPITIGEETQHREIIDIFLKNRFQTVPIVSNGHLIGCKYIDDFIGDKCSDNFKGFHSVYIGLVLWLLLLCA